jgi:hypothetical protein
MSLLRGATSTLAGMRRARAKRHSGGSVQVADSIAEAVGDSHVLYNELALVAI